MAVADKDHLHHRLMRLGHGQTRSVLILWAWTAILSGLALWPVYSNRGNALVPFGVLRRAKELSALMENSKRIVWAAAVDGDYLPAPGPESAMPFLRARLEEAR